MIADPSVARALSVLRSGPIFSLPSAVKCGPFSFFGAVADNTTAPTDLRLAANRSDSQLNQLSVGNNPGITLIITALEIRYDETANFVPTVGGVSDLTLVLRQQELQHQSQGVTRFVQLAQFSCSQQSNPTNGNIAQTPSGMPDRGPRMLAVPMVVDMEHDAIFSIAPLAPINLTAPMLWNLTLWGIGFSNSLTFRGDDCLSDEAAVQIGQQGAAMDTVLSPAFNPEAYR